MDTPIAPKNTAGFYVQAIASFGISSVSVALGIAYLPVNGWMRAFLALGVLYVITSSITLAKVVRDKQESEAVVSRVDQARLDRILAEHDPFKKP